MTNKAFTDNDVIGFECKHVHYIPAIDRSDNDLLFVKGYVHLKDGRLIPQTFTKENFKRPFWVTRQLHRNHQDKKEWEDESKLMRFESTQISLVRNAAKALSVGVPMNGQLRRLARSPYLYGCDITPGALLKQHYMARSPELRSSNQIAVSDTETDIVKRPGDPGFEEIIIQSITFKNQVYLVATEEFFNGMDLSAVPGAIQEAARKYIGTIMDQRNIQIEIELVKNAGEVAFKILQKAHQWQPDFLTFWNMEYDISKMEQALLEHGYDLGDAWSDPSVAPLYRSYTFKKGQKQKITASGKTMPLHPAEQWHSVIAPTSFFVIDSMCVYLRMRIAKGKQPSYALNAILAKELKNIQKLDFAELDAIEDGRIWHQEMQKRFKIEYCVYNIFDCIAVELLDERTTDLQTQISAQCEYSEYWKFPSQPRRTCDDLHFFVQDMTPKKVCATTSDEMFQELDTLTTSPEGWINTLRSDLIHDDGGIAFIEELPGRPTLFYRDVGDLDLTATYPTLERALNLSKETTANELCNIVGIPEALQRSTGINLTGGYVNAVEILTSVFHAPTFDQIVAYYRGDDIYPPEFDEMLRTLAARTFDVSDISSDTAVVDEDSSDD